MRVTEGVTVDYMTTQIAEWVNISTLSTYLQIEIGVLQSKFNTYRCLVDTFLLLVILFTLVYNGKFCEIVLCCERMFMHVWMSNGRSGKLERDSRDGEIRL